MHTVVHAGLLSSESASWDCRIANWQEHHQKSEGVSSKNPLKMDVSAVSKLHLYHVPQKRLITWEKFSGLVLHVWVMYRTCRQLECISWSLGVKGFSCPGCNPLVREIRQTTHKRHANPPVHYMPLISVCSLHSLRCSEYQTLQCRHIRFCLSGCWLMPASYPSPVFCQSLLKQVRSRVWYHRSSCSVSLVKQSIKQPSVCIHSLSTPWLLIRKI